jgi:hypothetical protein
LRVRNVAIAETVRLVIPQIFCVPREAFLRRGAKKNKSAR